MSVTPQVVRPQEISLDGVQYRTDGPVRTSLISIIPGRLVVGDPTRNDSKLSSAWTVKDAVGGLLVDTVVPSRDIDRGSDGDSETRYAGMVGLPPLVTDRGVPAGALQPTEAFVFGDDLYVSFGKDLYVWDEEDAEWDEVGSPQLAFADDPTQAVYFEGAIWVACGDNQAVTIFNGTTLAPEAGHKYTYLQPLESKLYAMSSSGELVSVVYDDDTSDYVWADEAILDLPASDITGLGVFRDLNGNPVLYVQTRLGLWYYDRLEKVFLPSQIQIPRHRYGGVGATVWRGDYYFPFGISVLKYGLSVQTSVGLDRDDGLPMDQDGNIVRMVGGFNWLYAFVKSREVYGEEDPLYGGGPVGETDVLPVQEAFSALWVTNGQGTWHRLWKSSTVSGDISIAGVFSHDGRLRLWWAADGTVYSMDIPEGIHNPQRNPVSEHAPTSFHVTPWFDADWAEEEKLALGVRIGIRDLSLVERIRVEYALDGDEGGWVDLGWITSETSAKPTGVVEFKFEDGLGFPFYSIKFRFTFERGGDPLRSPWMRFFSLAYVKAIDAVLGYGVTIDTSQPYKKRTPAEMEHSLSEAINRRRLLPFRYKDLAGHERSRTVRLVMARSTRRMGFDDRGKWQLELHELAPHGDD